MNSGATIKLFSLSYFLSWSKAEGSDKFWLNWCIYLAPKLWKLCADICETKLQHTDRFRTLWANFQIMFIWVRVKKNWEWKNYWLQLNYSDRVCIFSIFCFLLLVSKCFYRNHFQALFKILPSTHPQTIYSQSSFISLTTTVAL